MRWNHQSQLTLSLLISFLLTIIFVGQVASQSLNVSNQVLVDVKWLINHQDDLKLVIVDARSNRDYKKGHIPGAINIPVSSTFNPKINTDRVGNLKYITALFSQAGIQIDNTIVIYDGNSYIDAGRVFWVFEVYGHKNVKLLNGGVKGWQAITKRPLSQADVQLENSNYIPAINPQRLITKFSMRLAIEDKDKLIIDTRKKEDFIGDKSIASRSGHIPNAINIPWTENFVEIDGVQMLKPLSDLKKVYDKLEKEKGIILYCNKGKQSSLSYTIMRQLGYDAAHYDGSWYEWGNDVALPIVEKNKNKIKN